ncbi:MAG: hypothetical protein H3Z49_04350 [archaeon]|nr:hypothetical protein [archaeon]
MNWYGRFYFSFVMQEGYPGICTIIAVNPPETYTADIELRYTNPLDQRLVDIINGLSAGVGDIGGTLDDIWSAVDTMEADLLSWMTTNLKTNIDKIWSLTGNTHGWSNLASALDDIKGEINDIWGKVDDLDSWFGSGGKYSKTEQIVAGKGSTTFTDQPYYHYIFT